MKGIMQKVLLLVMLLNLFSVQANNILDSLEKAYLSTKTDSIKINLAFKIVSGYNTKNGDYEKASYYALEIISIAQKIKNKSVEASANSLLGSISENQNVLDKALNYYLEALRLRESINDEAGIALCQQSIASVYWGLNRFKDTEDYLNKAIVINTKIGAKVELGRNYNFLGMVYGRQGQNETAATYFEKASTTLRNTKETTLLLSALNNLGISYMFLKKLPEAEKIFRECLHLYISQNDNIGIGNAYYNLGHLFCDFYHIPDSAIVYFEKAYKLHRQEKFLRGVSNAYGGLMSAYNNKKDFKNAFEFSTLRSNLRDTILNESFSKSITEMQVKYDTDKRKKEIEILNKNKEIDKLWKYTLGIGLFLLLGLAVILLRNNAQKKKANQVLQAKNHEINQQKEEITTQSQQLKLINVELEQQKEEIRTQSETLQEVNHLLVEQKQEIESSIRYAERIQKAILPEESLLNTTHFPYFVLHQARDIVSGDFYWFAEQHDTFVWIVADCTGHGVPGALMSMVGNTLLKQIVEEKGIVQPHLILQELHKGVRTSLQQNANESRDGMDVTILTYHKKTQEVHFSGANHILFYLDGTEIMEAKGDKLSIGGVQVEEQRLFTSQKLPSNGMFYLFSDGYADQFGGKEGKKMMRKTFREFLKSIQQEDLATQKNLLQHYFQNWKGQYEQTDDVLVIGLKIGSV